MAEPEAAAPAGADEAPPRTPWWARRLEPSDALVAALAALLFAAHALAVFDPAPFMGGDNATYLALARSILETGSYRDLYDPALPFHTQYPPVFPAVLALALALGAEPWIALKLVVVAFGAAAVGLTYLWARRRHGASLALALALVLALSPNIAQRASYVLSDLPFWALSMAAVWAFERLRPGDRRRLAVAAAATALAYLTRTAGLPLVVAATGWLALERRWRQLAVFGAVAGAAVLLWAAWGRAHGAGSGYGAYLWMANPYDPAEGTIDLRGLVMRVVVNARLYLVVHLPRLLLGATGPVPTSIAASLAVLAAAGWGARMRRPGVVELLVPLYLGLILVWPEVWADERFLLPVLPFPLAYAGAAVREAVRRRRPGWGKAAVWTPALLLLVLGTPARVVSVQLTTPCLRDFAAGDRFACTPPNQKEFAELAVWSAGALPDSAAVISRKPTLFWAFSGRRSRIFPFSSDPDTFLVAARAAGARYLALDVFGTTTATYLEPVLQARPDAFCVMHVMPSGQTALFGIRPEALHLPVPAPSTESRGGRLPTCGPEYWREGRAPAPLEEQDAR